MKYRSGLYMVNPPEKADSRGHTPSTGTKRRFSTGMYPGERAQENPMSSDNYQEVFGVMKSLRKASKAHADQAEKLGKVLQRDWEQEDTHSNPPVYRPRGPYGSRALDALTTYVDPDDSHHEAANRLMDSLFDGSQVEHSDIDDTIVELRNLYGSSNQEVEGIIQLLNEEVREFADDPVSHLPAPQPGDYPDEFDFYISPAGPLGSRYEISVEGRYLTTVSTRDAAEAAMRKWMDENGVFPDAWEVNERGSIDAWQWDNPGHYDENPGHWDDPMDDFVDIPDPVYGEPEYPHGPGKNDFYVNRAGEGLLGTQYELTVGGRYLTTAANRHSAEAAVRRWMNANKTPANVDVWWEDDRGFLDLWGSRRAGRLTEMNPGHYEENPGHYDENPPMDMPDMGGYLSNPGMAAVALPALAGALGGTAYGREIPTPEGVESFADKSPEAFDAIAYDRGYIRSWDTKNMRSAIEHIEAGGDLEDLGARRVRPLPNPHKPEHIGRQSNPRVSQQQKMANLARQMSSAYANLARYVAENPTAEDIEEARFEGIAPGDLFHWQADYFLGVADGIQGGSGAIDPSMILALQDELERRGLSFEHGGLKKALADVFGNYGLQRNPLPNPHRPGHIGHQSGPHRLKEFYFARVEYDDYGFPLAGYSESAGMHPLGTQYAAQADGSFEEVFDTAREARESAQAWVNANRQTLTSNPPARRGTAKYRAKDPFGGRTASGKPRYRKGSGGRFQACVEDMRGRPDVDDPEGLCASIGRRTYGKRGMASMAKRGRARNPGKEGYLGLPLKD